MNIRGTTLLVLPLAALALGAGCAKVIVRARGRPAQAAGRADAGQGRRGRHHRDTQLRAQGIPRQRGLRGAARRRAHGTSSRRSSAPSSPRRKVFDSVDAARLEPGILAIFEPRIEQYSFANAQGDRRHLLRRHHPLPDRASTRRTAAGRHVDAHGLRQRTGAEDRQRPGRARDRRLRGDARCGREISDAVPDAGRGEAVAAVPGAGAEGKRRCRAVPRPLRPRRISPSKRCRSTTACGGDASAATPPPAPSSGSSGFFSAVRIRWRLQTPATTSL